MAAKFFSDCWMSSVLQLPVGSFGCVWFQSENTLSHEIVSACSGQASAGQCNLFSDWAFSERLVLLICTSLSDAATSARPSRVLRVLKVERLKIGPVRTCSCRPIFLHLSHIVDHVMICNDVCSLT